MMQSQSPRAVLSTGIRFLAKKHALKIAQPVTHLQRHDPACNVDRAAMVARTNTSTSLARIAHARRAPVPIFARLLSVTIALAMVGCATSTSVYTPQTQSQRDPLRAQRLTLQAVDLAPTNPAKAEALASDLYHGPAHNNLGIIFLKRGQLYEAASEFEWARKLLPGHPDPRVNLAMTLEHAGRSDEALATYTAALEVYPSYLPAMQGLARLQIRRGTPDEKTDLYLREIAMRGDTAQWRNWASVQMIRRPGTKEE